MLSYDFYQDLNKLLGGQLPENCTEITISMSLGQPVIIETKQLVYQRDNVTVSESKYELVTLTDRADGKGTPE